MQELKKGSQGKDVERWQSFLHGKGYPSVTIDGDFGAKTEWATREFQKVNNLENDGVVGQSTIALAMTQGLPVVTSSSLPPRPSFDSPSKADRERMLGKFRFQVLGGGQVKILDGWSQTNIVKVHLPQLAGVENAPEDCFVYFHRAGAKQLQSLFAAWEDAGLLHLIKTWAGSFVPRMVRGSATALSNHAYGSAFDINAAWNGLGRQPATGEGTVIPLVKLANQHGFFWGGHYQSRKDGMHFELAVANMFPKTLPNLSEEEVNLDIPTKPVFPPLQNWIAGNSPSSAAGNVSHNSAAIPAPMSDENGSGESSGSGASDGAASTLPIQGQSVIASVDGGGAGEAGTTVCKERPSSFVRLWTGIIAVVGAVTGLGVNVQSLFQQATEAITTRQIIWMVFGLATVALALWFYDRSANRANRLNQQKMDNASDPNRINTELRAQQ